MRQMLFLIAALSLLLAVHQIAEANMNLVGEAKVILHLKDQGPASHSVSGTVTFLISLPQGQGTCYIPFPIDFSSELAYYIHPDSTHNTVLFGNIRPDRKFFVAEIELLPNPSKIQFDVRNVAFASEQTSKGEPCRTIHLLIDRGYQELLMHFPSAQVPYLKEIVIDDPNFLDSVPSAKMIDGMNWRTIYLEQGNFARIPVILTQRVREKQYFLYLLLSGLGLIIGIISAIKIVSTTRSAIFCSIFSVTGLFILAFVLFRILTVDLLLYDTTTIVTVGMAVGTLFGLLFGSLPHLFNRNNQQRNLTNP
jgi:hypothetical protein